MLPDGRDFPVEADFAISADDILRAVSTPGHGPFPFLPIYYWRRAEGLIRRRVVRRLVILDEYQRAGIYSIPLYHVSGYLHRLMVCRTTNHSLMGRFQSVALILSVLDVRQADRGYAQHFVREEMRPSSAQFLSIARCVFFSLTAIAQVSSVLGRVFIRTLV